jgi:O-antigen/teichoic acid export membrane protein
MRFAYISLLKDRLTIKGSFVANVLTLMSGTTLAQGIFIAAAPILTRLYTPQDFGMMAVFDALVTMLLAVATWRYEWSIVLPQDKETGANLFMLCLAILMTMSLITCLTLWLLGPRLLKWLKAPLLQPYLWILPLSLFWGGAYQVLSQWSLRQKAFGALARTNVSQGVFKVFTQCGMGLFKSGVLGLLLGDMIGRARGCSRLAVRAKRQNWEELKTASFQGMRRAAYLYKKFPLFLTGSALLNAGSLQMPNIFLGALYGPQVVGWFALGQRVVAGPMALISNAASQVFSLKTAELVHGDVTLLKKSFYRVSVGLLCIGLPFGLIALAGPWLMPIIFGKIWQEAGVYTQLLSVMLIAQFVAGPTSHLITQQFQHQRFFWELGRFTLTVGIFLSAYKFDLSPMNSIMIYGFGMTLTYIIIFILNNYAIGTIAKKH